MDQSSMRFTKDHEWVRPDGEPNEVVIGITDFAAGELGDIVFVELPSVGDTVTAGEAMGTIEAVKTVADLFAPVSGKVVAVNTELEDAPDRVNTSPFEDGWFVRIEMSDPTELEALMRDEAYREMTGQ